MTEWEGVFDALRRLLGERYQLDHITLQPEPATRVARIGWSRNAST